MKKLRRKIVYGVLLSATVVFVLTIVFSAVALNVRTTRRADEMTRMIIQYNGKLPEFQEYEKLKDEQNYRLYGYDGESLYRLRHFVVYYKADGSAYADITHIAAIDEAKAIEMADLVVLEGNSIGNYLDYRYRISDDQNTVVFLDVSDDMTSIDWLILLLSLMSIAFIFMITVVFYLLSKRIVKPFEENSRMQKQFITDASHELKTPLAIISANAEVLAYKDGENEWINNITTQVGRISDLVNELLTLNRLEEIEEITDIETVNLSELTVKVVSDFEEVFSAKKIGMISNIEPDVTLNGNADQLARLISVLTENASKYTPEGGTFSMSLKKESRYTALTVFNSCEIDPEVDYSHLFERFYRPDTSRTSSAGGHGIGLSVAKRIVTLHGGTIEAVPSDTGLTFNVRLSNKIKPRKHNGGSD